MAADIDKALHAAMAKTVEQFTGAATLGYDLSCPEASHYKDCPRFRRECDAINCWAKYSWQEYVAHKKAAAK